jgi:hypothetical protein
MSTEQMSEHHVEGNSYEPKVLLEMGLHEANTLRDWLLRASVDGVSSVDTPVVSAELAKLGRAVDTVQAVMNVRREFEQVGLNVSHWSDEQVLELGRRITEAARPVIRA